MGTMYQTVVDITTSVLEPESRVAVVEKALRKLHADSIVGESGVSEIAKVTTVAGALEKTSEKAAVLRQKTTEKAESLRQKTTLKAQSLCPTCCEHAAKLYERSPSNEEIKAFVKEILAQAKHAEGRKQIVCDTTQVARAHLITPAKAYVAPYIAKANEKKEAVLSDARVIKMLEGLKHAKEHPMETASELREMAVDLIKYENIGAYREYVLSPQFQADTLRIIKEDLPQLADRAAAGGLATAHATAERLREELLRSGAALKARAQTSGLIDPTTLDAQIARLQELSEQARALILAASSPPLSAAARLCRAFGLKLFADALAGHVETDPTANADDAANKKMRTAEDGVVDPSAPSPFSIASGHALGVNSPLPASSPARSSTESLAGSAGSVNL